MQREKGGKVVVVGAGASGLVCASILREKGVDVEIVEAQDYVGGRVKSLRGFVEWKALDLGAEFVHGDGTPLKDIIDKQGWPCRLLFTWAQGDGETPALPVQGGISAYWLGREKKLLRYDTDHPEIRKANETVWNMGAQHPSDSDKRTLEQYLIDEGVSEQGRDLADAGYANTVCSASDRLSFAELTKIERVWDLNGDGDFRLDGGLAQVPEYLARGLRIRTSWPVKRIAHGRGPITLVSEAGQQLEASRVVVTVPLPVLKAGRIEFDPPLPQEKIKATQALAMDGAIKVVMKFSRRFWPDEFHGVICSHSFLPELWFDGPQRVGALTPWSKPPRPAPTNNASLPLGKAAGVTKITTTVTIDNASGAASTATSYAVEPAPTYIVSGFATSRNADRVGKLSRQEIIYFMLQQLDEMFANGAADRLVDESQPEQPLAGPTPDPARPATSAFLDCLVYDWGKNPYVGGGYSSANSGSSQQVREDLARPIDGRVFFAGEATNPTNFMTMHGAMETGETAAKLVLQSMGIAESDAPRSRL
eukprot:TRINITY_DN18539_c0_g1_i1.p1 TRINITY_DN18539_c0_g1~~TRINITY_DN18539_c0_g1_i1.p1  ORF type:complete len:535 (+),score=185.93 TRINITY_DN18539_c0_g1_i1:35-1639(+)